MHARNYTFGVALCLACAASAAAQTAPRPGFLPPLDDRQTITRLLQSASAREQAWGAWYAGRDHHTELVPLLHQVVLARANATSLDDSAAVAAALDALIQMQGGAPAELLPLVYERRPAEALILASHARADATPFLLHLMKGEKGEAWFAAANLLLSTHPRGYAAALLESLEISVYVRVSDDGAAGGVPMNPVGAGIACGGIGVAPGLPPWAVCRLNPFPHPGVVVLAPGPKPIYYRRSLAPAGQTPTASTVTIGGPNNSDRLEYVAKLLGREDSELPVHAAESFGVRRTATAGLNAELARIREDVQRRYTGLLRMLFDADLLAEAEARAFAVAPVDVILHD